MRKISIISLGMFVVGGSFKLKEIQGEIIKAGRGEELRIKKSVHEAATWP